MKTQLFLLVLLLLTTYISRSQDMQELIFAKVYYKKAWHIIDINGGFIPSQESEANSYYELCFSDGLAISYDGQKFGFTDFNGKKVIPNKYNYVQCFQFGFASVVVGDKWGVINAKGEFLVQPEYDYAGSFGPEGLIGLVKDNKLGFADREGKVVIPFKYYWRSSPNIFPEYPFFTDGLVAIIDADGLDPLVNGKVGFMNTTGELVIEPQFDLMNNLPVFIDGKTTVFKGKRTIVIDTLGKELIKLDFNTSDCLDFVNGFATLSIKGGYQGVIADNGNIILEPKYSMVNDFSEGFAAVQINSDEDGVTSSFINCEGKFVFDKKFGFVRDFHEGLAAVEIDGKWGYIDTLGNYIIKPQFITADDFYDDLAIVSIKKENSIKYGFINKEGEFVLEPIYNEANKFQFGLAPVKIGDKFGYINLEGEIIIKPKFENAFSFYQEQIGWKK